MGTGGWEGVLCLQLKWPEPEAGQHYVMLRLKTGPFTIMTLLTRHASLNKGIEFLLRL